MVLPEFLPSWITLSPVHNIFVPSITSKLTNVLKDLPAFPTLVNCEHKKELSWHWGLIADLCWSHLLFVRNNSSDKHATCLNKLDISCGNWLKNRSWFVVWSSVMIERKILRLWYILQSGAPRCLQLKRLAKLVLNSRKSCARFATCIPLKLSSCLDVMVLLANYPTDMFVELSNLLSKWNPGEILVECICKSSTKWSKQIKIAPQSILYSKWNSCCTSLLWLHID